MKVSCSQQDLSRGLGIVGRAVTARTTLPITQNVLIATDQSRLKLSATNLEIALSCSIGAQVEEEGAITIPARLISQFVDSLPPEKVSLELSARSHSIVLRCGRFQARLNGLDAADFPPIPAVNDDLSCQLDPNALHEAIDQVVLAAATDDTRPVLTGVQAEFEGDTLTLAAADGFRLAVRSLPLSSPVAKKVAVIIPSRSLAELARLLDNQEEPVAFTANPQRGQARFSLKNVELVTQLIQGSFPNYSQLIPANFTTRTVINTAEYLKAARTVSILARDGGSVIRLQITPGEELTPGKLNLSAKAEEVGDDSGEIDASINGQAVQIAFNSKYLVDVLSAIRQEKVSLETTTSSSPGVLRPVDEGSNYIHVIMPMFVQW
ncbi:MAG: DNA polymerase III subunit beta [Chloroflexota bacterium]